MSSHRTRSACPRARHPCAGSADGIEIMCSDGGVDAVADDLRMTFEQALRQCAARRPVGLVPAPALRAGPDAVAQRRLLQEQRDQRGMAAGCDLARSELLLQRRPVGDARVASERVLDLAQLRRAGMVRDQPTKTGKGLSVAGLDLLQPAFGLAADGLEGRTGREFAGRVRHGSSFRDQPDVRSTGRKKAMMRCLRFRLWVGAGSLAADWWRPMRSAAMRSAGGRGSQSSAVQSAGNPLL